MVGGTTPGSFDSALVAGPCGRHVRRAALHDERAVLGADGARDPRRGQALERDRQRRHDVGDRPGEVRRALGQGREVGVGEPEAVAGDRRLGLLELRVGVEARLAVGVDHGLDGRRVADGQDRPDHGVGGPHALNVRRRAGGRLDEGDRHAVVGLGRGRGPALRGQAVGPGRRLGGVLDAEQRRPPRAAAGSAVAGSGPDARADLPAEPRLDVVLVALLAILAWPTSRSSASESFTGNAAWSSKPGKAFMISASSADWLPGRSRRSSA